LIFKKLGNQKNKRPFWGRQKYLRNSEVSITPITGLVMRDVQPARRAAPVAVPRMLPMIATHDAI
jgi:hypothetical protein